MIAVAIAGGLGGAALVCALSAARRGRYAMANVLAHVATALFLLAILFVYASNPR